ncbi:hypothetical protein [Sphingobacterium thalpophilum]|uniref:hypothetical protein n=1 Tax=Sphingobacterium thalpophilum TaxID=259 RepID=UPI003D95ED75
MPNITNQAGVSIDSLQTKITLLESQFTKLHSEHKVLLDSLRSLNTTIKVADIKTSFFTDQLAFQLFIFSCILGVLTLISWASIFRPFQNKIKKLSTITIPKVKSDIKTEMDESFTKITKDLEKQKTLLYEGYIDNLRISVTMAMMANNPSLAFGKIISSTALDLKFHMEEANKVTIKNSLAYAKELLDSNKFSLHHVASTEDGLKEVERYIKYLTKHDDDEISILAFKILEKFRELKMFRRGI